MLAQRLAQRSLRNITSQQSAFSPLAVSRPIAPSIQLASLNGSYQKRLAATQNVPQNEGYDILVKQRLNRPVSPHLGIYRPQITWYGSIMNRITGSILSGAFYIFGFGYLVQPVLGLHWFESPSMVAAAAAMPLLAKIPLKFFMAFQLTYHSFNGIRHLVWDTGRQFTNQQVIRTGWFVMGLSAVTAGLLAFI